MRRTRRVLLGLALVAILSLAAGWPGPGRAPARGSLAQDAPSGPADGATPLGLPRPGETAWELIGRGERGEREIAFVGFLTHLAGAAPDLPFAQADAPSEATARFTVVATLEPRATSGFEAVRGEATAGTLTVFFRQEAGADFDDPASFGDGVPVAAFAIQTRLVFSDQDGTGALLAGSGDLTQTAAEPFDHDGTSYRLGRPGARLILALTGVEGAAGAADPDRPAVVLAGRAELAGAGPAAEPPAATPDDEEAAGTAGCEAIRPWFETTSAQVADVERLAEFLLDVESVRDLDADQLRAAAAALATLGEQQRAVELPAEAAPARDAVAAAITALAEAVFAVAAAVEAGSTADLDAALEDLSSALDDLRAAVADAEALAAPCLES